MVISLGMAISLFIGIRHVQAGSLTLGEFLLVMAYLTQLSGPLETVTKKVAELQSSLASAERAFALLAQPTGVPDRAQCPTAGDSSFAIASGSRVGVVGSTGAGKTTLLNLLTRFYDPHKRAEFCSTASICATIAYRTSGDSLLSCCRSRSSSPPASQRTSVTVDRTVRSTTS